MVPALNVGLGLMWGECTDEPVVEEVRMGVVKSSAGVGEK